MNLANGVMCLISSGNWLLKKGHIEKEHIGNDQCASIAEKRT